MVNSVDEVFVATPSKTGDGYVFVGAEETVVTTPAAPSGTISGMVAVGFVSDSGFEIAQEWSTESIRDMGLRLLRTIVTEETITLTVTFRQWASKTLQEVIAAEENVTESNGNMSVVYGTGALPPTRSWAFDLYDPKVGHRRVFIPRGTITALGNRTYAGNAAVDQEVTITAEFDQTLGGSMVEISRPRSASS